MDSTASELHFIFVVEMKPTQGVSTFDSNTLNRRNMFIHIGAIVAQFKQILFHTLKIITNSDYTFCF